MIPPNDQPTIADTSYIHWQQGEIYYRLEAIHEDRDELVHVWLLARRDDGAELTSWMTAVSALDEQQQVVLKSARAALVHALTWSAFAYVDFVRVGDWLAEMAEIQAIARRSAERRSAAA